MKVNFTVETEIILAETAVLFPLTLVLLHQNVNLFLQQSYNSL